MWAAAEGKVEWVVLIDGKSSGSATDNFHLCQGGKFMEVQAAIARGKLGAKNWAEFIVILQRIHFTANLPILPE